MVVRQQVSSTIRKPVLNSIRAFSFSPVKMLWNAKRGACLLASSAVCLAIAGCGAQMKVAPVTGTVTLDGQPLEQVSVLFQPDNGRPSFGVTDKQGKYQLAYNRGQGGAEVGECTVKVTEMKNDEEEAPMKPVAKKVKGIESPFDRYAKDPLKVKILPKRNTIDIALTSQPAQSVSVTR